MPKALCCINLILLLALGSCLNVCGDSGDGGDAGAFLKNGIGVRPISMGKAFVAVADDSSAGYWNPAGLATLKNAQLSLMYSNPMNYGIISGVGVKDIGYHTFSMAYPTRFGSVGLNMAYLSVGDIYVVKDATGQTGEKFEDKELGVIASYARRITNEIQLGLNLKFVRQSIWDKYGSGIGSDLGMLYKSFYNFTLGVTLQDLIKPDITLLKAVNSPPRKLRLGGSYKLMDDRVLLAVGIDKAGGRSAKFHFGAEARPLKDMAFRAGYTTDTGEMSAGVGFRVSLIQLDYGFGFLSQGSTHRVSFTTIF